jgi:hypothetical protein
MLHTVINIGFGFHRDPKMESYQNLFTCVRRGGRREASNTRRRWLAFEARAMDDGVDEGADLFIGGAGVSGVAAGRPFRERAIDEGRRGGRPPHLHGPHHEAIHVIESGAMSRAAAELNGKGDMSQGNRSFVGN